jgi:hypothetical protein
LKHENYDFGVPENDVALITLANDVVFNDKIQPACLPPRNLSYPKVSENENEKSFIAGWGKTELNPYSELLQNLAVNIRLSSYCRQLGPFNGDSKVCLSKYYYFYYF